MKKTYTNPEMNISVFMNEVATGEDPIIVSANVTAATYTKKSATSIFNNAEAARNIIVF